MVYLTTLLVTHTTQHPIAGRIVIMNWQALAMKQLWCNELVKNQNIITLN